jgi:hypothetical protein
MRTNRTKLNQIMLKSLSAVFVVWLSGVLVLVGCNSSLFKASAMNFTTDEAESCPLGEGHECCKKKAKVDNNLPKVSEDESKPVDCCAFKPVKTLSADLSNSKNTKQTAVATEKVETPKPVYFIKQTYKIPQVYHSAIRNRGSIYLKNCVFLI